MMKMKKISYLLILPILVFSIIGVVGCNNDGEDDMQDDVLNFTNQYGIIHNSDLIGYWTLTVISHTAIDRVFNLTGLPNDLAVENTKVLFSGQATRGNTSGQAYEMELSFVEKIDEVYFPSSESMDALKDFFVKTFPPNSNAFYCNWGKDTCCVINSEDDFRSICTGITDLPSIDFDSSTLIVGVTWLKSGNSVQGHTIDLMNGELTLRLQVVDDGYDAHGCSIDDNVYWGVYPKLPSKHINIKR